jgi:hypothetical protein
MRCLLFSCLPCSGTDDDVEQEALQSPHGVLPLQAGGQDVPYHAMKATDCTPAQTLAKSFFSPNATAKDDENTPPQQVDSQQRGPLTGGSRYSPPTPADCSGVSFSSPLGMNSIW